MSETILVAEDDPMVRNMLVRILSASYYILEADNAVEALCLSRKYDGIIHLVVANESLKTMRACELFVQLQQSRPDLKFLQISGYTPHILDKEQALIYGAAFLQKPFLPKTLLQKVHQILEPSKRAVFIAGNC
jgi:two-component system, cell cycle sensor histidine kinase and response regulator CckA